MAIQFSYYSALLFLSAIITASLAIYGWRNRKVPIAQPFSLLMAAATLWTCGEAIQGLNVSLATSIIVNTIEYTGIVMVPVAWFILALYYTGRSRYVNRAIITLLCIIPAFTVVLVATNPLHYLYYSGFTPEVVNGVTIWLFNHGPLFPINLGYTYILSILAFFLVFIQFFVQFDRYRKQTLILLIASLVPFIFNLVYVVQPAGLPQYDLTPISFTIMGILIAFGILRYRLFSGIPIVYASLFDSISDDVFVTDLEGEIIDVNPAALALTGKPAGWVIGKTLSLVIPELPGAWNSRDSRKEFREELTLSKDGQKKYYAMTRVPLLSDDIEIGYLVTLRDITEQRNALIARETANRKVNLLSDVTRHDINNQLTVLLGYLYLVKDGVSDPKILNYIEKEEHAASTISQQILFTREYQNIGMKAPAWQDIRETFQNAVQHHLTGDLGITIDPVDFEVFADPLFEKTFYNLIDNSLRHGGEMMKNIRISSKVKHDGLFIFYDDDGVGIPVNEKSRIFERGFGKTGEQGLFLLREILSITGITIGESGIPGKGCRFELFVPNGMYRASHHVS